MKKYKIQIVYNSPAVLTFAVICLVSLLLDQLTAGWSNYYVFSVYRSSLLDPLFYVRLFGHVLGHASWSHLYNNILYILILGPMLEEKYGSKNIILLILLTAFITGLVNVTFFPNTILLGASGVVFAFILLSSITSIRSGEIPLTFIIVSVIYIGGQIADAVLLKDSVSQLSHILGGITGCVFGYSKRK